MAPFLTPLGKRLASYSAAAGITLAVAPSGNAQVVYVDVNPDATLTTGGTLEIDVDNDGTTDLGLTQRSNAAGNTQARINLVGPTAQPLNGALGQDAPYFANPAVGSAFNLDVGDTVGPSDQFFPTGVLGSVFNNTPYYNFLNDEGYAGFRFVTGGETHYGWMRVAVNDDATGATVFEYAYQSTPATAITVGDTGGGTAVEPDALADGYRFSPIAPNPVAGRSRFDVAVGQTETVRVEIFDALGRSVDVLFEGALPGGQARTFEVASDRLPAGVYVVRVTGESFDTTRSITVLR